MKAPRSRAIAPGDLAFLLAIAALVLAGAVARIPWPHQAPADQFTPELIRYFHVYDSAAQRLGHRAALFFLALFGLTAWATRGRVAFLALPAIARLARIFRRSGGWLISAALLPLLLAGFSTPKILLTLASIGIVAALAATATQWKSRLVNGSLWLFVGAYAAFLMLPGLFETPDLSSWRGAVTTIEQHYSLAFGGAMRVAQGQRWFSGATPYYGLLLSSLLATAERHLGILDFGAHIRLVQVSQILFCALALLSYRLWDRRGALFVAAPFLLLAPWIHNNHDALFYPNQSAWRSIGLPLAVLAILSARKIKPFPATFFLGVCAGLFLLLNLETGICLAFGCVIFLLGKSENLTPSMVLKLGILFILGTALPLGIYGVSGFQDALILFRHFSGGFGGEPFYPDPAALLMFVHASAILLGATIVRAKRPLHANESFRAAIAGILLVWFAYYANRPEPWNLWTYWFLYSFLIIRWLNPHSWRLMARRFQRGFLPPQAAFLALAILPIMLSLHLEAIGAVQDGLATLRTPPAHFTLISGVWLHDETALALLEKAQALREKETAPIYFTANPFLIPLITGLNNRLPLMDTFGEAMTEDDVQRLLQRVLEIKPPRLYFDDPDGALSGSAPQRQLYARLQQQLAGSYRPQGTEHGWMIWEKKAPAGLLGPQPRLSPPP